MGYIAQYILLVSSIIAAIGVIWSNLKGLGNNSKKIINKYIDDQVSPNLVSIKDCIEKVHTEINDMKRESDEDKMQRLRYECLCFASDIRKGEAKTRQEYEEIFRMEAEYDRLIAKYDIVNGFMEEEMLYTHNQYRSLDNK